MSSTIFSVSFKKQVVSEKGRVSMKPHKVLIEAADFEAAATEAQRRIDNEEAFCEMGAITATKYEAYYTVKDEGDSVE